MPSDKVLGGAVVTIVLLVFGAVCLFGCYRVVHLATVAMNKYSEAQVGNQEPAHGAETVHEKRSSDKSNDAETVNVRASCVPGSSAAETEATIEMVVTRLLDKLQRGEITLQPGACPCDAGKQGGRGSEAGEVKGTHVTNVTRVTNVTHETRLQYQCLLSDKMRWRLMENDLKKAVVEEMEVKMADTQAETDRKLEMVTRKITENRVEGEELRSQVQQMDNRLQELDSRLALEPQFMEIRGFMKIDSFGPLLLVMGALHMIEILLVCFLFARLR